MKTRKRRGSPWWSAILFGDDCWEWTGATHEKGYGRIRIDGELVPVHRYVWERLRGPIPEGLHIDHLCRNPKCCKPSHLEPVTPAENVRRGVNPNKKFCARGHEYTEDNTYRTPKGNRQCRICKRAAFLRFHEKKADEAATK